MRRYTVAQIEGDGIGPEVSEAVLAVLQAGAHLSFQTVDAGRSAVDGALDGVLPQKTVEALHEHHVALEGPCATPVGKGFSLVNVIASPSGAFVSSPTSGARGQACFTRRPPVGMATSE